MMGSDPFLVILIVRYHLKREGGGVDFALIYVHPVALKMRGKMPFHSFDQFCRHATISDLELSTHGNTA